MSSTFRNDHLSYSRLQRFEQCPLSFRLHYIEKHVSTPGAPLRFGSLVHSVLEQLLSEVVTEERTGPLSEDRALTLYRDGWTKSGLGGVELFQEGLDLLRAFLREQGVVDHRDVLAVEQEFRLPVGPFTVLGFIDRVDRVGDDAIEIIDYKTNRQLFTRDEVDQSLQMSLYELAAKRLWPWAKEVRLSFYMLRHGLRQTTSRTPEQLLAALAYTESMGRRTEAATEFPARLNGNCPWCDHRTQCPAYADALTGRRTIQCDGLDDIEEVAKEREEVARLAKILYARKDELEAVLKERLQQHDELVLNGIRYRMFNTTSVDYPLEPTLRVLGDVSGLDREALIARVASIDKKAVDALVKELARPLGKSRVTLLKAELEATADKRHSPRFWASAVKEVA